MEIGRYVVAGSRGFPQQESIGLYVESEEREEKNNILKHLRAAIEYARAPYDLTTYFRATCRKCRWL